MSGVCSDLKVTAARPVMLPRVVHRCAFTVSATSSKLTS